MEYRKLELTLISAENLKDVNLFSKMNVYAVVSVANDPHSGQKIPPDRVGGRNPVWNSTVALAVPASEAAGAFLLYLHVLLRTERALGDRDVGEVTIPLGELLGGGGGGGAKLLSVQVRRPRSKKTRGVINLSYRLGGSVQAPPVMAYPPPQLSGGYYGRGYGYGAAPPVRDDDGIGFGMGLLGGLLIGDMLSDDY